MRAQYNLQAQGLRTRIEIRVNRIPMSLRRAKMGDLADKHKRGQHPQQVKPTPSFSALHSARPPVVPERDTPLSRTASSASAGSQATTASRAGPGRPPKRTRCGLISSFQVRARTDSPSDEISGDSKENDGASLGSEAPNKKPRGNPAIDNNATKASKVLSPASTNVRSVPRPASGGKTLLTRLMPASENVAATPKSPVKKSSASNLLSSWAEKARSTRKDAAGKRGHATTSTTASSATGMMSSSKSGPSSASGIVKDAAPAKARRASGISESSEGSTSTVVKKSTAKASEKRDAQLPAKKTGVMGSIRRGVTGAGTVKKTVAARATPASTATGRVLRKRN